MCAVDHWFMKEKYGSCDQICLSTDIFQVKKYYSMGNVQKKHIIIRGGPFLCTGFKILSTKAFGWVRRRCPKELEMMKNPSTKN